MNAQTHRVPEAAKLTSPAAGSRSPFSFSFVAPLALGATLNPINSTMMATALVPIANDFHANVAEVGLLIAGLYLASAIAQPTMGRLADLYGPRRIYLLALFLVAVAGLLGCYAPSLGVLIAARVLLGIGTSGAYPSAMRMFRVRADQSGCKPPRVAMGFLSLSALSTSALGPLLGGVLTGAFGWHSIFTINIPLALGTAVLVLLWAPKDSPVSGGLRRLVEEVDLVGIGLFAGFLLSLMIFLTTLTQPIWGTLWGTAVLGVAFVGHSIHHRQPFIDLRMLASNAPLTVTYIRAGALMTVVYSVIYGFAQWLESGAGFSSTKAGLVMLPLSVVAAASSLVAARTKGIRGPFIVSIGAALVGCACLLFYHAGSPLWWIVGSSMLFGLPQGMSSTATQAAIYIQAPASEIGTAAGLQRTAQYTGAITATSALGLLFGQHATDRGFHSVALVMGLLCAVLLVATIFDPTLPRGRVG